MANIKPTHKDPISPQSEKFEKDFKKSMVVNNLNIRETQEKLNEVDAMLSEAEQSLKKKIFSLAKMESLVFSDPKLSAVYEEMAENGEEKYGYHYNETIQNMIFNDYVLNSPQYLQKYKNAIPKEKKRRDKSGINQLKKQGEKKMTQAGLPKLEKTDVDENVGALTGVVFLIHPNDPEVFAYFPNEKYDEKGRYKTGYAHIGQHTAIDPNYAAESREASPEEYQSLNVELEGQGYNLEVLNGLHESTTAGSAGGAQGYTGYAGPSAWSKKGDLMGNSETPKKIRKPIANITTISESNYLTDSKGFEKYIESLNEETDADFISRNGSNTYGDVNNMTPENQKIIKSDIQNRKFNNNNNIKDGIALNEKSVSKNQQQLMGMAYAYKTGKFDGEPSAEVIKLANSMSEKDLDDFASTKHKGLPEKVNEELYDKIVKIEYFDKAGQLRTAENNIIPQENLHPTAEKPIKLTFTDSSDERVSYDEFNELYLNAENVNEVLSGHDTVEYLSDRTDETPFEMAGEKWQFVNAKYPDGKQDLGVYRFGHDLVYDYARWMEEFNINENNIKEDTQTMIQNNGTSMSNKSQATGDMSSEVPMGTQAMGGLNESDEKLLEEINKELEAFSIHHDKLKIMSEERKTNSQILNARVGDENQKNFKKDFKDSDTKKVIDVEKELQYKDQQTDVPKDPQKLGLDIEKQAIKNADMNGDEALKNVGDSTNDNGDEIPKRNLTTEEQDEVNLYRNGQHSIVYDNEPDERFIERQKADQGEFFEIGEKQKKFKGKAPTYNKDTQPVEDGIDKVQFDKDKSGWNEREGLKESMITGRYIDVLGKRRLMEFRLSEVNKVEKLDENIIMELSFDGLGNTYMSKTVDKKVVVNETVVNAISSHKFYTDGNSVVAMKNPTQNLHESDERKMEIPLNEQMDKMKHLLGYKPNSFVNTKNVKKNRGF